MPPLSQPCGTRSAYERHRRNRESACDACRAANLAHTQAWRRAYRELLKLPGVAAEHARVLESCEMPRRHEKAQRVLVRRHREDFRVLLDKELAEHALAAATRPEGR
ncbi:hypothetical protein GCM10022254_10200 [Actinomadura meridiana]|uniref:Uncharacterized protein n=1 Tax=Actinomadura meridiana TaxID=559626 RepID=A0ABP8BUC0_9ACTN